jgi:hypothetical protein
VELPLLDDSAGEMESKFEEGTIDFQAGTEAVLQKLLAPSKHPLDFNCHQRLSTKSTITLPSWAFKFAQKVILSAELAHGATSCTWGWPMGPTGARGGGGL